MNTVNWLTLLQSYQVGIPFSFIIVMLPYDLHG